MSNISTFIDVASNSAFSNLYKMSIGAHETPKTNFRQRIENVSLGGASLEYRLNEATKQHQIVGASRYKTINFKVREDRNFYILKYLSEWYQNIYDAYSNTFVVGSKNAEPLPLVDKGIEDIVKKRTVTIWAGGNQDYDYYSSDNLPPFYFSTDTAMIQTPPVITYGWNNSTAITYDVTLVCDTYKLIIGTGDEPLTLGSDNQKSVKGKAVQTNPKYFSLPIKGNTSTSK